MNEGRTIFQQLLVCIKKYEFQKCVSRYEGNKGVKSFSCWDQFLCMLFAQLTFRESLRDTVECLRSQGKQLYHIGIRGNVRLNTLSNANSKRDWRIYRDFAQVLIKRARSLYQGKELGFNIMEPIYVFDSTTIELCLSMFRWARFSKTRAAIKMHTLLELRGSIPTFIRFSKANKHDMTVLDELIIEPGAYYVMDRGYMDFERLYRFSSSNAFFIVREKKVAKYRRLSSEIIDKTTGIRCDQTVVLKIKKSRKRYPDQFRRVSYYDSDNKQYYTFITNNFELPALTIANLYKARWSVELFFKWIKQHLRIKTLFGQNENAVKTQIWIAICAYLIIAINKKEMKIEKSLYNILQIVSISIFSKNTIFTVFNEQLLSNYNNSTHKQLDLFDI